MKKLYLIVSGANPDLQNNDGSTALYIACRALDLKKKAIFWTVPNTYASTANAGILCGENVGYFSIHNPMKNKSTKSVWSAVFP